MRRPQDQRVYCFCNYFPQDPHALGVERLCMDFYKLYTKIISFSLFYAWWSQLLP